MSRVKKITVSVLLAVTMALSVVTVSMHQMVVSAANSLEDIEGIVGQFTEDSGFMRAVVYDINVATGAMIDESIEEIEEVNKKEEVDRCEVYSRDWSLYHSGTPFVNFTDAEWSFYSRLDELSAYYMDNNTIDAYYVSSYNLYTINGVKYSDLGLNSTSAFYVAEWFLYNNPQYYFLKPTFLTTPTAIYMCCYDVAFDGGDRAEITNYLFDNIDYIVDYVLSAVSDDYDIEKCLHDVVCGNLTYSVGDYDQSIYSALMEGSTVCAGYSGMMNVLLNYAGINTVTVLSDCHAWNEVYLDGEWYAVDVTWDDSLSNYYFFNVCDKTLKYYDSASKNEHLIEDAWIPWTPVLSDHDYGLEQDVVSDIILQAPEVSVEKLSDTSARLIWDIVPDADMYEVCIYSDETYINPKVIQKVTDCSLKLTGLRVGYNYYYSVRASRNKNGSVYYSDYTYGVYECVEPVPDPPVEDVKLAVPANLRVDSMTDSSFKLIWDPVQGISDYEVSVYKNESHSDKIAMSVIKSNTVTINGVKAGQKFYLRVRSVKDGVYSDYADIDVEIASEKNNEESILLPPLTDIVTSDITETTVRLMWTLPASYTDCKIELDICKDVDYKYVLSHSVVSGWSVFLKGLTPGMDYYVRLRSVYNNNYSDWCYIMFTTESPFEAILPSGLIVSDVTTDKVSLKWDKIDDAYYMLSVKKSVDNGSTVNNFITVYDQKLSDNFVTVSGLESGSKYFVYLYSVIEHNGRAYTSDSVSLSFNTKDIPVNVSALTGVDVCDVTTSSVRLIWPFTDGVSYRIFIYKDSGYTRLLGKAVVTGDRVSLKGLSSGTEYYCRIQCSKETAKGVINSDFYDFSVKTLDDKVSVSMPSSLSMTKINDRSVQLQWTSVQGASYEFYIYSDNKYSRKLGSAKLDGNSLRLSGVKSGVTYYVAIRSYLTGSGETVYSDWYYTHFKF